MRSRSRSPTRRHSPGHRSRSSHGNGESSGTAGDRCLHCLQPFRRHHPGPEGALPDKDTLKNMIVNPQGARPQGGQTITVEEVKIPRRYGEGIQPLFGFMSARRVVQILPVRPDEGNNPARSSSNQRDGRTRFDRHERGRLPDSYRPRDTDRDRDRDREDEKRREERKREREREEERSRREQHQRDRDRKKEDSRKSDLDLVKTEVPVTEAPKENRETHENGGPSHGGHGPRPQWRPPVGPPMFYPPPHGYPPMGPPPIWGPYPPPPRPFHPRPNIRRPPRY